MNYYQVLAVFNRNANDENIIEVKWDEFKGSDVFSVYDVWRQKEIGSYQDGISVKLSPDGVALFKLNK